MSFLSKEDAKKIGKGMGLAACVIAVILLTSLTGSWVVMSLCTGAACYVLARLSTNAKPMDCLKWAVIGAIAGLGFWAAL